MSKIIGSHRSSLPSEELLSLVRLGTGGLCTDTFDPYIEWAALGIIRIHQTLRKERMEFCWCLYWGALTRGSRGICLYKNRFNVSYFPQKKKWRRNGFATLIYILCRICYRVTRIFHGEILPFLSGKTLMIYLRNYLRMPKNSDETFNALPSDWFW